MTLSLVMKTWRGGGEGRAVVGKGAEGQCAGATNWRSLGEARGGEARGESSARRRGGRQGEGVERTLSARNVASSDDF